MQKTEPTFEARFPAKVNRKQLLADTAAFFDLPEENVKTLFKNYRRFYRRKGYRRKLREKKTLCFEEAFLVYVAMLQQSPKQSIVEIGTQYGQSTRRIVDMTNLLGLKVPIVCFDIEDLLKFVSAEEVELRIQDLTGHSRDLLFKALAPDFIFLDAHPYYLLKDVIESYLEYDASCTLAIHDCGRGLCNPNMTISKDTVDIKSSTGVWERHVLAETLGIEDPLDPKLDHMETETHRVHIFDTPNGLALIRPL